MAGRKKQSTESAVREIRRRTRRKFAPEEKVRPGSGLMVQRCGFFVAPIREHLQEMGLIIPTLTLSAIVSI